MAVDEELRILGIAEGDPWAPLTLSGAAASLFAALDRRFAVVARIDYGLRGRRRAAQAALTFRPSRSQWVARFHLTPRAHRVLSATLGECLRHVERQFDLVFQVYGWVAGQPQPYCMYVDQTRAQIEAGWPKLLPMNGRALAEGRRLEQPMYARAEHIFTMGDAARESLIDHYGISPNRVTVAGGGLNFQTLPPARREPVREPRILFVGREFERKGGEVLLEAFQIVRERVPRATLHIVGPRRRFTDGGVHGHGLVVDRKVVQDLYAGARVLCAPSLYEPWGYALVEAMSHGVPCIATSVQSMPEILDHGRAGLLVPPGDASALAEAIVVLLGDDELAHRLGTHGRRLAKERYTWDHVVETMTPAILSATQGRGPSSAVQAAVEHDTQPARGHLR